MVGTGTLVFAVNMTGINPIGIPMVLFLIIIVTGPITGGHVNPAVTVATFIIRYKDWKKNIGWTLWYLTAEYLGALLGVGMVSVSMKLKDGDEAGYPQFAP